MLNKIKSNISVVLLFSASDKHYTPVQFDVSAYVPLVISYVPGEEGVFYFQLWDQNEALRSLMADIQSMLHSGPVQSPQV